MDSPHPGTTQYPHLIENSGAPQVRLTDSELREIDAALAKIPLQGGRADPFTESQFDKINTCCYRETAGKVSSVLLPGINHMNGLNHNALTRSAVPIPPCERSLQTVEAQPYFSVSEASLVLEGVVFDRNNNLLFVDVVTGRVFKLTPERQLSIVLKENTFGASGPAVHKDGRIFIASVGDMQRGSVRAIEPDGTREQMVVAPDAGFLVNDTVLIIRADFIY